MRQFKHKIAVKTLEKMKLTPKQIQSVYSFKSKEKQESKAKRFAASNKANRIKKFYTTPLGGYQAKFHMERIQAIRFSGIWDKLTLKQQKKYEADFMKWENRYNMFQIAQAKTRQAREDLIEAKKHRIEEKKARLHAGERVPIRRTTAKSYEVNKSTQTTKEDYVKEHYPNEFEELTRTEYDKNGNVIKQGLTEEAAIDRLWDEAIAVGDIQPLMQGVGVGYIDDNTKEVISPV